MVWCCCARFVFFVLSSALEHCTALFPYTTLFRSVRLATVVWNAMRITSIAFRSPFPGAVKVRSTGSPSVHASRSCPSERSEEHTAELQSHVKLVCRLLLEKKNAYYLSPRIVYRW